jgi:hypothetical protein
MKTKFEDHEDVHQKLPLGAGGDCVDGFPTQCPNQTLAADHGCQLTGWSSQCPSQDVRDVWRKSL